MIPKKIKKIIDKKSVDELKKTLSNLYSSTVHNKEELIEYCENRLHKKEKFLNNAKIISSSVDYEEFL